MKKQARIFRQRLQVMLESQLEVVKSPEWNELLKQDDDMDQFQDNTIYGSMSNDNVIDSEATSDSSYSTQASDQTSDANSAESVTTVVFPDDPDSIE